jgi:hypothetical protein
MERGYELSNNKKRLSEIKGLEAQLKILKDRLI